MPPQDDSDSSPAERQALSAVMAANAAAVAALLALERAAVAAASGPLRRALVEILRRLSAQYVLQAGGLERGVTPDQARVLADSLSRDLADLADFDPTSALQSAASQASSLGTEYAGGGGVGPGFAVAPDEIPAEVQQIIDEAPQAIADAIESAQRFTASVPIQSWDDVVLHVSKASQAATSLERRTAVVVERSHSDGIQRVAVLRGARILWVAEPDACVVCLALSGHLADPATGQWFDEEATFGRAGSAPAVWPPGEPLKGPPRHPYCRCVPELWFGPAVPVGAPGDNALYGVSPGDTAGLVDLPAALRREAKRSIAYGWSLPSESGTVRMDAASRLLSHGAGLPRSVEDRARKAVDRGRFDNRIHPSRRSPRR